MKQRPFVTTCRACWVNYSRNLIFVVRVCLSSTITDAAGLGRVWRWGMLEIRFSIVGGHGGHQFSANLLQHVAFQRPSARAGKNTKVLDRGREDGSEDPKTFQRRTSVRVSLGGIQLNVCCNLDPGCRSHRLGPRKFPSDTKSLFSCSLTYSSAAISGGLWDLGLAHPTKKSTSRHNPETPTARINLLL